MAGEDTEKPGSLTPSPEEIIRPGLVTADPEDLIHRMIFASRIGQPNPVHTVNLQIWVTFLDPVSFASHTFDLITSLVEKFRKSRIADFKLVDKVDI